MVDQLTLQTIGILLTGISLTTAAAYYILTLQNTQKNQKLQLETRQAQLFMNLYETYRSLEFRNIWYEVIFTYTWEDYDDYWRKYGAGGDILAFSKLNSVSAFYEGIGVLLKRKLIDISMVNELLYSSITITWDKLGPVIKKARTMEIEHAAPKLYMNFEYLYNELMKYIDEHPELAP